jgi:transposase
MPVRLRAASRGTLKELLLKKRIALAPIHIALTLAPIHKSVCVCVCVNKWGGGHYLSPHSHSLNPNRALTLDITLDIGGALT